MFTAICRDAKRLLNGSIESKWEIVDDGTQKTIKFQTYIADDAAGVRLAVKADLQTLVISTDDAALKIALIGKTVTV